MLYLRFERIETVDDAARLLQQAIGIEFGTLPPYLYALYSLMSGRNAAAATRIERIVMEEMVHMCLGCNMLNALGKSPVLTAPTYPGPLPGCIRGGGKKPLIIHLLPFSRKSMRQAMSIEQPECGPISFPHERIAAKEPRFITIGQFYRYLDRFLARLPASKWSAGRNQIDDRQFLQGAIFAINRYEDARRAIDRIVSEGEGARDSPLDFEGEVAHYYRFAEVFYDRVLTKASNPEGYAWKGRLGVDWKAVYPAVEDPGLHDFSNEPVEARAAQVRCNLAFTRLVQELQETVAGEVGRLGNAVRSMFELRMAAKHAMTVRLADGVKVAGPGFLYDPSLQIECAR